MLTFLVIWILLLHRFVIEAAVDNCRSIEFISPIRGKVLIGHVFRSVQVPNEDVCEISCYQEPNCVSYNYGQVKNETSVCELNNRNHQQVSSDDFVSNPGYIYRYIVNSCQSSPCLNDATCQAGFTSKGYRCICSSGYLGNHCSEIGPTVPVVICEGNSKQIECNNGGSINVVSANYGRLDYDTCPHPSIHTNNCRAENSLVKVQETCQRKTSCVLYASGSIYGDPCPGTYKYLLVEYRCEG